MEHIEPLFSKATAKVPEFHKKKHASCTWIASCNTISNFIKIRCPAQVPVLKHTQKPSSSITKYQKKKKKIPFITMEEEKFEVSTSH